ncbi:hypothetical protein DEO72_LG9g2391 [Vigna unguiculata]|uniref:TPM domain-containing protein n=1 Tax=Vigna unguiculata TaxID=3917 RepID=A0A4D6N361_VIGUN|nr:hypothetical protein DEO72_LG9g2391 [Vigna unguiculata]
MGAIFPPHSLSPLLNIKPSPSRILLAPSPQPKSNSLFCSKPIVSSLRKNQTSSPKPSCTTWLAHAQQGLAALAISLALNFSPSKADAFEYADQVLERWYPSVEEGNNKGIVVLITSQKEVLATDEKYNEAIYSTAKRLVAAIDGLPDPGGPTFKDNKRESNFKTKEETEQKRGQFTLVVGGLLVIAFVVPMAQYYAYVSKK